MDINVKKAIVMMATYNGEKYIEQQIKSLQQQTFCNWELFISDDNSTDKTLSVIRKLQKKDSRIKKVISNTSHYHGAYANFFNIMYYVKKYCNDYDYYFFCDQDDKWAENKIELQIKRISKYDAKVPVFCYCNLELCNQDLKDLHDSMANHIATQFIENPYNSFFKEQYVWGTSMAFNLALWKKVPVASVEVVRNDLTHDGYISKLAAVIHANIEYISEPLISYRRTGNNVSGTPRNYHGFKILKRIFNFNVLVDNAASTFNSSIYVTQVVNSTNELIKDVKKCFLGTPLDAVNFINKYNILQKEPFLGTFSTKIILYLRLYRLSKVFKNNFYEVKE